MSEGLIARERQLLSPTVRVPIATKLIQRTPLKEEHEIYGSWAIPFHLKLQIANLLIGVRALVVVEDTKVEQHSTQVYLKAECIRLVCVRFPLNIERLSI